MTRFVTKGLQEAGHTVDHADNGRDGMFLAASEPLRRHHHGPHAAGQIDGLGIIEALRKSGNRTPILILSALSRCRRAHPRPARGGDDYLTKPFAFGELLARVDALGARGSQGGARAHACRSATCAWTCCRAR